MTLPMLCPKCEKQVGVPMGTQETAEVRCPLCDEQFLLRDATNDDMPALIVVDPGPTEAIVEADAAEPSTEGSDFGFGIGLDDQDASDDGTADASELKLEGSQDDDAPISFEIVNDDEEEKGEDDSTSPMFEGFGDSDSVATEDSIIPSFGGEDDESQTATAQRTKASKTSKGPGIKGQVIGIVLFGIIGLGLGYGILRWLKPVAVEPFDEAFESTWASVSSLWSGDAPPSKPDADNAKSGFPKPGEYLNQSAEKSTPNVDSMLGTGTQMDPLGTGGIPAPVSPAAPLGLREFLLQGQPDTATVFRAFDVDEVESSLDAARNASSTESGKISLKSFLGLCDLGEHLAHRKDSSDPRVEPQQRQAESLILGINRPELYSRLSAFSYQWLQFSKRPESMADDRGVFLVGEVQRVVPVGPVTASTIKVERNGKSQTVLVLTKHRPDYHVHDKAAVLGSAVRDPSSTLPGYAQASDLPEADPSLVILGGAAIKLPEGE